MWPVWGGAEQSRAGRAGQWTEAREVATGGETFQTSVEYQLQYSDDGIGRMMELDNWIVCACVLTKLVVIETSL